MYHHLVLEGWDYYQDYQPLGEKERGGGGEYTVHIMLSKIVM
uniref:Uncharacterized protein n=1 Tax=Amphimedon queenslandica TaxID=400682 RepID=A0A1X7UNQ8_AMPQE